MATIPRYWVKWSEAQSYRGTDHAAFVWNAYLHIMKQVRVNKGHSDSYLEQERDHSQKNNVSL